VVFFGHAGIALGAAVVLNGLLGRPAENEPAKKNGTPAEGPARRRSAESWVVSLSRRFDLRLLLLGAIVSDIIDKPAGYLFYGTFGCRLFCHSLLFLLIVAVAGLYLYLSRHKNWLLVVAFGILTHLALDEMWLDTQTFLWPAQGFSFPTVERSEWAGGVLHRLFTSPKVYVPELLGLVVIVWIAWLLVRRGKVHAFVRHGQI
jgi:inner membrane protein